MALAEVRAARASRDALASQLVRRFLAPYLLGYLDHAAATGG